MKKVFEQTTILGVRVDLVSLDELMQYVLDMVQSQKEAIVSYVNVHAVNIAHELEWFKDFINTSQVVFCDGFGVKWAVNFLRGKKLQRFTPPDWFDRLASECTEHGVSMFFLGTRQEVVKKAATVLKEKFPQLRILGVHHGYFNKTVTSSENQEVVASINALQPDILVVGFGMPAQEKWILENRDGLNVHIIFPVGAFFDYLSREVVRAPRWMTDHGFEWLGRLWIEPRRLWRRYLMGNSLFAWRVLLQKLQKNSSDSSTF